MNRDWEDAVRRGDARSLEAQLRAGADVDARDQHGQTALMVAAHRGHIDAVRLLLQHHPDLDHTAKYSLSALMLAAISGHTDVVRALVDAGARRDLRGTGAYGFAGKTALDIATAAGREEIAAILRS